MAPARRRRALRTAEANNLPANNNVRARIAGAAFSPAAKAAYAVIGTAGLAALAIAVFGPKRFQREILNPVQNAVSDQTSQLWSDSRGLREQIGNLFARAGDDRDRLVKNFQSWVGHFRAT